MFWNSNKKDIDDKNIKRYNNAIKAIKAYTKSGLFKKAVVACDEILKKEKEGLENLIKIKKNNPSENDLNLIKKETKIFEIRKKEIKDLKEKARILEIKYRDKIEVERFKKKFKTTKRELKNLLKLGKPLEAMSNLKYFLEQNAERIEVVNFYNNEKKIIQGSLDKEQNKLKKKMKNNAKAEAMNLIGQEYETKQKEKEKKKTKRKKLKIFSWFNSSKNEFIKKLEEEKILEEVNKLIEENKLENEDLAKGKLENIHKGLIKELKYKDIPGFNIYGKILGADKISGDVFSIDEKDDFHRFFLGDATGHGVQAGLIVTLLNKNFRKFKDESLQKMVFDINNSLKQSLESKNFITGAFFEISKKDYSVSYIGMGHEPILFYKNKTKTVNKEGLGGLAAGIRIMKDPDSIKVKKLEMNDGDIFLILSDGVIEARNELGEYYGLERVEKNLKLTADSQINLKEIYNYIINDLKLFKGGTKFNDDATILIVKRDKTKDIVKEDEELDEIVKKNGLNIKEVKELVKSGGNKEELQKKINDMKRKKEIEKIVQSLETTYYNGEVLKLKQDAIRYVKDGFIDKRINFYLRKAIENEKKYKIDQKEQKIKNKYLVLEALFKKGNYDTVIKETEDIISKDGI